MLLDDLTLVVATS